MPDPFQFQLTTPLGPGYTSPQTVAGSSIGGFAATTAWAGGVLGDLFGMASSADIDSARPDYRCVYVFNPSYTDTISDVRAFVDAVTAGGGGLSIGLDPRPVTYVDSTAAQAVEPGSAFTAPSGVTFSSPANFATGLAVGNLPPRAGRPIWFRRVPASTADAAAESVDVTVTDGALNSAVRRVTWTTEPASTPTNAFRFPQYTPTPSPFRRLTVDFLTEGGARTTWELDQTMTDAEPHDFQLQGSQVGSADADDWTDVGPPSRNATYLIDPSKRLWGASATTHYRVVLTTPTASYTSDPVNVYGSLRKEQWLAAREVFRKERLLLRRLTGWNGFLLKARRYGPTCLTCTDPTTFEVGNSSCPVCFGTGITSGYHPPVAYSVCDVGNESYKERVAYNEGLGVIADSIIVKARALAVVPIFSRDAWVAVGSDRRYYVHKVVTLAARHGVPIVYDLELRLAMRSDVLYSFPVVRPPDDPPAWEQTEHVSV